MGENAVKTTIDRTGRIELGQDLQAHLGVQPGDEVILEARGNECVLKAANPKTGLAREGNVLVHHGVSTISVGDAVSLFREERLGNLSEGLPQ